MCWTWEFTQFYKYIRKRIFCWKPCSVRDDQTGWKTAERIGGSYSVQAKSRISAISSRVQPSGGLVLPDFISITSFIRGILHLSSSMISLYLIFPTVLGLRSSILERSVRSKMFCTGISGLRLRKTGHAQCLSMLLCEGNMTSLSK